MKHFIVLFFTLRFFPCACGQTNAAASEAMLFAESQFGLLVKQDFSQMDSLYMTELEVRDMCSKLEPQSKQDDLNKLLLDFDQKKKQFIQFYKESISPFNLMLVNCDSVVWDQVHVDSVAFAYEILDPTARNKKVYWPSSKTHAISEKEITICKAVIYFNDGVSSKLACSINSCYYNNRWRYFEFVRPPKFVHITN